MTRYAHAIYCDDIREEVGNKMSLMGIYREKLLVSQFPAVLPKLCVALWVVTPIDHPFKKIQIRLHVGDQIAADVAVPDNVLADIGKVEQQDETKSRVHILHTAVAIANLRMEQPTRVKLRVHTEDDELKAGALDVELLPGQPASQPTAIAKA